MCHSPASGFKHFETCIHCPRPLLLMVSLTDRSHTARDCRLEPRGYAVSRGQLLKTTPLASGSSCRVAVPLPSLRFDSDVTPVHRAAFALESDVAGFGKGMLGDVCYQGSIQIRPNLSVLRNDLNVVPLPDRFSGPGSRGVIRFDSGLPAAHRDGHFEVVLSLNLQRSSPHAGLGDEEKISGVGVQVLIAFHSRIRV